jgi:hypothetical protein
MQPTDLLVDADSFNPVREVAPNAVERATLRVAATQLDHAAHVELHPAQAD